MTNRAITRNVTIAGRRTSVRMEPPMWDALGEICRREKRTLHEICTLIAQHRGGLNLTAAIRIFVLTYFRAAATDEGHRKAGHGQSSLTGLAAASNSTAPDQGQGQNPPVPSRAN